jgi:hypothetical protein
MSTRVKPHWITEHERAQIVATMNEVDMFVSSSVVEMNGKWYFMSVRFDSIKGPYDTHEECKRDCREYYLKMKSVS